MIEYKVVETELVSADNLEHLMNLWVGRGYQYDGCQFAMRESSKRPSMAFLRFTRESSEQEEPPTKGDVLEVQIGTPLPEVERRLILATLQCTDGDKTKAAKLLGVATRTVYRKLDEYESSKTK